MYVELVSAMNCLLHMTQNNLRSKKLAVPEATLDLFLNTVMDKLQQRYQSHWFSDKPDRGSAYRCIRICGKVDRWLVAAAAECNISEELLQRMLPQELTIWIDPGQVNYRIGENGSISLLYNGGPEPVKMDSLSSGNVKSFRSFPTKHPRSAVAKSSLSGVDSSTVPRPSAARNPHGASLSPPGVVRGVAPGLDAELNASQVAGLASGGLAAGLAKKLLGGLDWNDHSSCKPPGGNSSCKEYLHQMESFLDWGGVGAFEQLPQYVSS